MSKLITHIALQEAVLHVKHRDKIKRDIEIATAIGYTKGTFSAYLNGKSEISSDFIEAFENKYKLSLSEFDKPTPKRLNNSYTEERRDFKNNKLAEDVPVYGGFTSLGNITVYDDDKEKGDVIGSLPAELFPGCNHAEKAKGDSMYPIIMNQAWVVGKECSIKGIVVGEKYIIKTKDGMDTTKYVHPVFDENKKRIEDRFVLVAHNKSIPPQEIEKSDITFACRVLWIINPT